MGEGAGGEGGGVTGCHVGGWEGGGGGEGGEGRIDHARSERHATNLLPTVPSVPISTARQHQHRPFSVCYLFCPLVRQARNAAGGANRAAGQLSARTSRRSSRMMQGGGGRRGGSGRTAPMLCAHALIKPSDSHQTSEVCVTWAERRLPYAAYHLRCGGSARGGLRSRVAEFNFGANS